MIKTCQECDKKFKAWRKTSTYCSRICMWKNNGGHNKKQETWWKDQKGYIQGRIWLPDGTQIRVRKHRFIMEGIIGRPLSPDENVHHINGIKDDNRPINLKIIEHGKHTTLSNKLRIHKNNYKLNLSDKERKARSYRAIAMELNKLGNYARYKGKG